jgi:hypothetical protein
MRGLVYQESRLHMPFIFNAMLTWKLSPPCGQISIISPFEEEGPVGRSVEQTMSAQYLENLSLDCYGISYVGWWWVEEYSYWFWGQQVEGQGRVNWKSEYFVRSVSWEPFIKIGNVLFSLDCYISYVGWWWVEEYPYWFF